MNQVNIDECMCSDFSFSNYCQMPERGQIHLTVHF